MLLARGAPADDYHVGLVRELVVGGYCGEGARVLRRVAGCERAPGGAGGAGLAQRVAQSGEHGFACVYSVWI